MKPTDSLHDDELTRALRETFRDDMREAPPVPRRLATSFHDTNMTNRRRLGAWCGVFAAAATVVLALFLFERKGVAADPRAALEQAARAYLALDDATLRIDVRLQAVELLSALLSDDHQPEQTQGTLAWIRIGRPNRLVVWDDATSLDDLATKAPVAGFDGLRMWSYDRATNVAKVAKSASQDESGFDWMRTLSLDFVKELVEKPGEYTLVERTNATEKRAGLRLFAIERVATEQGDDNPFWTEARITIDGDAATVERIEARFKLGPIALAEATMEVVSSDDGFDAKDFSVDACAPKGAVIQEVDDADFGLHFSGVNISTKKSPAGASSAEPDSLSDPVGFVEAITGLDFDVAQSKARRSIASGAASYGLIVAAVRVDSPAAAAGIEPGDVVMKWNGEPIVEVADLALTIDDGPQKLTATVTFSRKRKDVTLFSRKPWADFEAKLTYAK